MVWMPSVCSAWPQCHIKILRIFSVLVILGKTSWSIFLSCQFGLVEYTEPVRPAGKV